MDRECRGPPGTAAAGQSAEAGGRPCQGPPGDRTEARGVRGGAPGRGAGPTVWSRTPLAPGNEADLLSTLRLYGRQMAESINSVIFRWVQK